MATPNALVVTGYGINCEEETAFALNAAGAKSRIVHVNDVIDGNVKLMDYQMLAFPGGFSFGDDTGSGNALANRIRNHLWDQVREFVTQDNLAIGICNGFQVMVNLGLLPALDGTYGERQVALLHNNEARYNCRWVDLQFSGQSPWVQGIGTISVPIAHGEGKFFAPPETLAALNERGMVAARYVRGEICTYLSLPPNPNGALEDIAAITDPSGRILGMMPHPERAMQFTQLPHWTALKEQYRRAGKEVPIAGPGQRIFENGVRYFR